MSIQLRHGLVAGLVLSCWLATVAVAVSAEAKGKPPAKPAGRNPCSNRVTSSPSPRNTQSDARCGSCGGRARRRATRRCRGPRPVDWHLRVHKRRAEGGMAPGDRFCPRPGCRATAAGAGLPFAMQTPTAPPPTPVAACPVGSGYTRDYYQAYHTSLYSHEPDPDIHAWQPWLH